MTPGQMEAAAAASASAASASAASASAESAASASAASAAAAAGTLLRWVGIRAFQTYQWLAAYMEPSQGRPKREMKE